MTVGERVTGPMFEIIRSGISGSASQRFKADTPLEWSSPDLLLATAGPKVYGTFTLSKMTSFDEPVSRRRLNSTVQLSVP